MALELKDCDLTRISWYLVTSLRSGRDWFGSLEMISVRDPEPRVRYFFSEFIKISKIEGVESAIRRLIRQAGSTLVKLFLHVLLQSQRGSIQLSKMLEQFGNLAYRTGQLKRKHQELQFTPRFQMWGTLAVTIFLVFIVPVISPIHMPTFLSQGRSDLFFAGVSLIAMGFILMEWLSWKTRRYFEPMIQMTFFFSFLGFFVESGLDLVTSWKSSLEMISNSIGCLKTKPIKFSKCSYSVENNFHVLELRVDLLTLSLPLFGDLRIPTKPFVIRMVLAGRAVYSRK
jgi:hypothetical protein